MALTPIQEVRLIVQDNTVGLYILSDDEIEYFITKNNSNITRASISAANAILMNLSMRGDETVDIFSIRGSKAAEQYRLSLQMFLRDPSTNPYIQNIGAYVGGISKADMLLNDSNTDNNTTLNPYLPPPYGYRIGPFKE
jgi:hypothetical protein